ncbi:MAG: long-chain fatty acid--CoA ligase [Bacillota bacterium]|nr:long-chain fatty acid--CoA ligase [Bacillota bacterium]MDW7728957.1 long-chain fatty acid--CoA ligase [Bacillota bacterium]
MWSYEKPDNLVEWWIESEKKYQDTDLFLVHNNRGGLDSISYGDIGVRIANVRGGLAEHGVKEGDTVGIISNNRPEWAVIAFAVFGRNAKYVPMYEKELEKTWKYIIRDSGLKFLIVSNHEIYEKVKNFPLEIPALQKIYIIESDGENSLASLELHGEKNPVEPLIPNYDDIAVLIYTSGTTADPKGVLLSHGNITYSALTGLRLFPDLREGLVGISMLPWAHSYAITAELTSWIHFGGTFGFMRDVSTLAEDMRLIRPHFLVSVPRVFNKVYDVIQMRMSDAGGMKKKLFDAACLTAKRKRELADAGKMSMAVNVKHAILDKIVFSKIREVVGGRIIGAMTGSAVMNKEIAEFFFDIGISIYDCYGLTETAPGVSMNSPLAWKIGSVGKVMEGQKVVIDKSVSEEGADDGEIIVYGPNVMKGYHNKPEETAAVIMSDGGFRTGDRGHLDEDGFLWITGRIKEQYKLSNGKYVFPASIEEEIKLLPKVANAMVYGDGKPYNVCLIYPDFEVASRWAAEKGVSDDPPNLLMNEDFKETLEDEIRDHLSETFGRYEIPEKFYLIGEDFTVDNKMLTQTMKLKRRAVIENYSKEIAALYN